MRRANAITMSRSALMSALVACCLCACMGDIEDGGESVDIAASDQLSGNPAIEVDFSCFFIGETCRVKACNVGDTPLDSVAVNLIQTDTGATRIQAPLGTIQPGECARSERVDVLSDQEEADLSTCNGARNFEFVAQATGTALVDGGGPTGPSDPTGPQDPTDPSDPGEPELVTVSDEVTHTPCMEVGLVCAIPCNFTCGFAPTECAPP
jgi:hypothetical protein